LALINGTLIKCKYWMESRTAGAVFLDSVYPQGEARTRIKSLSISNHRIVTSRYF